MKIYKKGRLKTLLKKTMASDYPYRNILKEKLRELSQQKSQDRLAREMGTTQPRISRLLLDQTSFTIDDLIAISLLTARSFNELIYGESDLHLEANLKHFILHNSRKIVNSLSKEEKKELISLILDSFSE